MINFHIPDFTQKLSFNLDVIQNKENLRSNVKIASVYDSFPNVIFNGGRCRLGPTFSINLIENIVSTLNNLGVSLRYTFTNEFITEKYLGDYLSNVCLEIAHNELNGVIVNNDVIENYVRKNFPKYKIISSTTSRKTTREDIIERLNGYDSVVLPIHLNKNFEFLSSLPNKEKIEIIINENCPGLCPQRKACWTNESKAQIMYDPNFLLNCRSLDSDKQKDTYMSFDELEKLNEIGINNFKIQGRRDPVENLRRYYDDFIFK